MTVGISGTLGMDGTRITKVYEDAVHVAREVNVMASLVLVKDDRVDDLPRQYNEHPTVETTTIGEYDDLATATQFNRAAGNTVTPKEEGAQVILTDKRRKAEGESVYSAIAYEGGQAMANVIEEDLLALFASITPAVGTAGASLTWGNIFAGIARLNAAGFRNREKHCVLHEYQWFDLANAVSLEQTMKNTPEAIKSEVARGWYVGSVANTHFFTSDKVNVDGSDDATGAIFLPEAFLLDKRKQPTLEAERDASRRADELNFTLEYGAGLWAPDAAIKVVSDATVPA